MANPMQDGAEMRLAGAQITFDEKKTKECKGYERDESRKQAGLARTPGDVRSSRGL